MKRFIFFLSVIVLFSSIFCKQYIEDIQHIEKRLKFLNDKSQEITNGDIIYKYTNQSGIYCEATRNIEEKEFVFNLKREHLITFCNQIHNF